MLEWDWAPTSWEGIFLTWAGAGESCWGKLNSQFTCEMGGSTSQGSCRRRGKVASSWAEGPRGTTLWQHPLLIAFRPNANSSSNFHIWSLWYCLWYYSSYEVYDFVYGIMHANLRDIFLNQRLENEFNGEGSPSEIFGFVFRTLICLLPGSSEITKSLLKRQCKEIWMTSVCE